MQRAFLSVPVSVDISITAACNLRCIYCYASASPSKGPHLTRQRIKQLFQEFETLGVHFVRIAGGEPFAHPDIFEILEDARRFKFLFSVSTNGALLSEKKVNRLKELRIPWLVISVDGPDSALHNTTRGSFDATKSAITRLVAAGIRTTTATVLTSRNAERLPETLAFIRSLGIQRSAVLLFCPVGRGASSQNELTPSPGQLSFVVEYLTKLRLKNSENFDVRLVLPHESVTPWEVVFPLAQAQRLDLLPVWGYDSVSIDTPRRVGCQAGISTCAIGADGSVFGCEQLMGFPELVAGNIYEKSFAEIWESGPGFRSLRQISATCFDEPCRSCSLQGCGGGCRAVAYGASGSLLGADPRCGEWRLQDAFQ